MNYLRTLIFILVLLIPRIGVATTLSSDAIFNATNTTRQKTGQPTLVWDDQLAQAAQSRADAILTSQLFSHTDTQGSPFYTALERIDYPFETAGENLAKGFTDIDTMINAWFTSPSHRANILDTSFTKTGIGITKGLFQNKDTIIVVQLFAKPDMFASTADIQPRLDMSSLAHGTVLGARYNHTNSSTTLLLFLILVLNMGIGIWLLEHWHYHRRITHIFTR